MLDGKMKAVNNQMKKSIFRSIDRFELLGCYVLCFCINTMFYYSKTISLESHLLQNFLKQLYDYQALIILLLSLTVVVFHYQMVIRKKVEVHCRVVVGDTIRAIVFRYIIDGLIILCAGFVLSGVLNAIIGISIANNCYLLCVFVGYILISSWRVRQYENL